MGSYIIETLLALLTGVVGFVSYHNSNRAAKAQAVATEADIDAEAYTRAKGIYESAINAMGDQVARLREQTVLLEQEVARLQKYNLELSRSNTELQHQVMELQSELHEFRKGK